MPEPSASLYSPRAAPMEVDPSPSPPPPPWTTTSSYFDPESSARREEYRCYRFAPYLTSAGRRYLLQPFQDFNSAERRYDEADLMKRLEEATTVSVENMPYSICGLDDFFQSKVTKVVDIHLMGYYEGKKSQTYVLKDLELDEKGRLGLSNIIRGIISNHRNGICWDGMWDISNWEVTNAKEVTRVLTDGTTFHEWEWTAATQLRPSAMNTRIPASPSDRSSEMNDLVAAVREIIPRCYVHEPERDLHNNTEDEGEQIPVVEQKPVFCQNFEDEIQTMAQMMQNPADPLLPSISNIDFEKWLDISLIHHPFLMNNLARSNLELGWHFEFDKKHLHDDTSWDAVLDDKHTWIADFLEEDESKRTHTILDKIFWWRRKRLSDPAYGDTLGHAVTYHRMLVEHGMVHCHVQKESMKPPNKKRMVTIMKEPKVELELLSAIKDENRLPRLIKVMFENGKVRGWYQLHWDNYTSTKDAFLKVPE